MITVQLDAFKMNMLGEENERIGICMKLFSDQEVARGRKVLKVGDSSKQTSATLMNKVFPLSLQIRILLKFDTDIGQESA